MDNNNTNGIRSQKDFPFCDYPIKEEEDKCLYYSYCSRPWHFRCYECDKGICMSCVKKKKEGNIDEKNPLYCKECV